MKRTIKCLTFLFLALPAAAQVPCSTSGVTVTVSPPVATPGQIVQVTLTNNSSQVITLPSSCSYASVFGGSTCSSTAVFSPACLTVLTPIAPGQSHTTTWDQIDNNGQQVPSGTYSFQVSYDLGSCCVTLDIIEEPTTFCSAKTGLVCGDPSIDTAGIPSATATSGFTVSAQPARSCRSGVLLYNAGSGPGGPYPSFGGPGNGVLCVNSSGVRRASPLESGGTPGMNCDGVFDIDMNAFNTNSWAFVSCSPTPGQTNPAGFLSIPGTTVHAQVWGRDSTTTGQFLSNGVSWIQGP